MNYLELCHSNKENDITFFVYRELEKRIKSGFATETDKRVFYNIMDKDLLRIIAYSGIWYINRTSRYNRVPNYFFNWAEKWLIRRYNITPLYKGGTK